MPVNTITYQPATAQLLAAYRPIVFKVEATATGGGAVPPYVVCDIYIADLYYKSIIRTAPLSFTNLLSVFSFDIADALQEYLQPDIAAIDNNNLLQAPHMSAKVFCKFRSSDIDADGFTVEEGTKPVQATKFTSPVSGTGLLSNSFFAINSALQHEDNQNLAVHLNTFKQGAWISNAYPLTHRNKYFFCPGDSDHFPVIYSGDCLSADLILNYRLKGQTDFQQSIAEDLNVCAPLDYELEVTGNHVEITLDEPLPADETVFVQYKKQADSVWIDAGSFTAQTFSFNVNGDDVAGDYDVRVIHFCTPCLNADPVVDVFTLDGTVINTAWRGIDPFCVVDDVSPPVYVVLESRNPQVTETYFPDDINPEYKNTVTTKDLYAKFYSDAAHLTPVSVVQAGLNVYTKKIENIIEDTGSAIYNREVELLVTFNVDASGVEVLLGNVIILQLLENYTPYPTVGSSTTSNIQYAMYPDHQLLGGNTGQRGYANLEEYNTDTNTPTGVTKVNDSGDPDYIPPVSDAATCPTGPDVTTITYGYGLEISKVEFHYGSTFAYADTVSNTHAGGYQYILPIPKNTDVIVTVKAKTLDSGNTSGYVYCRVGYIDGSGIYQTAEFQVPNNIETVLPQTFQNITNINISNY